MEECIFCKIVKGEVPSSKIYEDDLVIAFMDIKPVNPGHALVVSKEHQKYISDLDDKSTARLISVAGKINKALRKSEIRCEDVNYFLADGEVAGQEVAHAHLHIIPRFKNLSTTESIDEVGVALEKQLDFTIEAKNNKEFTSNFINEPDIGFPKLIEGMCTRRVLGMELIEGARGDEPELVGSDPKVIARLGLKALIKMSFQRFCFPGSFEERKRSRKKPEMTIRTKAIPPITPVDQPMKKRRSSSILS